MKKRTKEYNLILLPQDEVSDQSQRTGRAWYIYAADRIQEKEVLLRVPNHMFWDMLERPHT